MAEHKYLEDADAAKARCREEWSNVNDPPCHPGDADWRPCHLCDGLNDIDPIDKWGMRIFIALFVVLMVSLVILFVQLVRFGV